MALRATTRIPVDVPGTRTQRILEPGDELPEDVPTERLLRLGAIEDDADRGNLEPQEPDESGSGSPDPEGEPDESPEGEEKDESSTPPEEKPEEKADPKPEREKHGHPTNKAPKPNAKRPTSQGKSGSESPAAPTKP